MILAFWLLLVAAVVAMTAPLLLERASTTRSPMAGIAAWQVSSWSVLVTIGVAAALVAAPPLVHLGHLPQALASCRVLLGQLGVPSSPVIRLSAALLLAAVTVRLATCAVLAGLDNRRRRARHRTLLRLVGYLDPDLGVHVIDGATAVVYCLPGWGGTVVFTSSALDRLSVAQCRAVLAHELAHLRGRHHLVLAWGSVLAVAFPRVRLFRQASAHTARLIEMRADDVAARDHGPRSVAEALFALSEAASPAAAMAATAVGAAQRVERLLAKTDGCAPSRIDSAARATGALTYGLFAAVPALLPIASAAALCLL